MIFEEIYADLKRQEEEFLKKLIEQDKYWFYHGIICQSEETTTYEEGKIIITRCKQYIKIMPELEQMIQGELGMSILRMTNQL